MCWDDSGDVNKEAINLLLSIMQYHYKNFEKLNDPAQEKQYGSHIHSIIESLMKRIGGENTELRTQSLDALLKISDYPLMDYANQIDRVMEDTGTGD